MANNEFTEAKDELKQEVPEVVTRTIEVEGLVDLDKLVEEMEKIDNDQTNNMDKMYALDVFYGGKRSNPYFTLCKLLQELNNKNN
tara:strand:- start:246 stop:500 length:255 start_codon:yes stop_codon:yes gene_type:complete